MVFAWVVLGGLSLVTARRRRLRRASWWFVQHWVISAGVLVFSLAGVLFAVAQTGWQPIDFNTGAFSSHKVLGVSLLCFAGLQGVLGLISHCMYRAGRTSNTFWDRTHHVLGRTVWLASIVQCWLGISSQSAQPFYPAVSAFFFLYVAFSLSFVIFSDVSGYNQDEAEYSGLAAVNNGKEY